MGKKKEKEQANGADRPRRKELQREIESLREENRVLKDRIEQIAKIAGEAEASDLRAAEQTA